MAARRSDRRRLITPEDLLKFQFVATPRISPAGDRIAFVKKHIGKKNNYETNLWMVDTAGDTEPRQFTSSGKDAMPAWSPCGSTIAFVSGRDKPHKQIYTISADGGEARCLTSFPEGTIARFAWSPDGSMLAVSFRAAEDVWTKKAIDERKDKGLSDPPRVLEDPWYRLDGDGYFNGQRFHLYLVDVATGEHRKLYDKDYFGFFDFDFSPDSKQIVIATNRDRRGMFKEWKWELLLANVRTGRIKAIPNLPEGPKAAVKWSPDGKYLAYAGRIGTDGPYSVENLELFICDPVKGNARSLTAKTDHCLLAIAVTDTAEAAFEPCIRWTPDSRRLLIRLGWHGEMHIASIHRRGGDITFLTGGAFDYDLGNISDDGHLIALIRGSGDKLPEVGVGRLDGDDLDIEMLTNFNGPLLKEMKLSRPKSQWVKAADGNKVQVWTLMPPGHKAGSRKKYPGVLEIHGGPHAQYGVGFFHEFQVLAAAGYIVFYSNPRGSKGYGRDHCAAIRGSWGGADWVDIQAVIDLMKDHPNVDSRRLGCMGGSYGGYMTNWAIGHCNDFAGAISDRCVSNLVSFGGNSDFIDNPDQYFPGNFWDRPEARWEQSPIKYFGKVKTPTLIIHSEGDLRCNIEQSEQVFSALKIRNIPARLVRYPRSTFHGMSRNGPPDMRLHRLGQILGWWEKHL